MAANFPGESDFNLDLSRIIPSQVGRNLKDGGHDGLIYEPRQDRYRDVQTWTVGDPEASGTAWGCDLTEEYVTFNAAYST